MTDVVISAKSNFFYRLFITLLSPELFSVVKHSFYLKIIIICAHIGFMNIVTL